jgi:hypothetical protein
MICWRYAQNAGLLKDQGAVLTVELEEVEGVQHGLGDGAAAVERVGEGSPTRWRLI